MGDDYYGRRKIFMGFSCYLGGVDIGGEHCLLVHRENCVFIVLDDSPVQMGVSICTPKARRKPPQNMTIKPTTTTKKATILSYVYIPTLIYGINRENLDLNK